MNREYSGVASRRDQSGLLAWYQSMGGLGGDYLRVYDVFVGSGGGDMSRLWRGSPLRVGWFGGHLSVEQEKTHTAI